MSKPPGHADEQRRPRILCIAGSPRRHGNSEQLLDSVIERIEAAGGVAVSLPVIEYDLSPCRGCNACSLNGRCVLRDRMSEVFEEIDAADAIVVATPVYFATVPAVLKTLYDRCQPYWARQYVLGQPLERRRPGAVVVVAGGGDPYGSQCAVATTKSVFAVLGIDCSDVLEVTGPDSPGDIIREPESIRAAERLGATLVELALSFRDAAR